MSFTPGTVVLAAETNTSNAERGSHDRLRRLTVPRKQTGYVGTSDYCYFDLAGCYIRCGFASERYHAGAYSKGYNVEKAVVKRGTFKGTPIGALGAADGKLAYVAFKDEAVVAAIDLERQSIQYTKATNSCSSAFTVGLSNNVCH